jgi:hypothetical protein
MGSTTIGLPAITACGGWAAGQVIAVLCIGRAGSAARRSRLAALWVTHPIIGHPAIAVCQSGLAIGVCCLYSQFKGIEENRHKKIAKINVLQ